jgi:O-antigen ligase
MLMTQRRPFYLLMLTAGLLVPLTVALSPWAQIWIDCEDISLFLGDTARFPYTAAVIAVALGCLAALAPRIRAMLPSVPARQIFLALLFTGYFVTLLPGPYVGSLLLCYYFVLLVAALAGHDVRLRFTPLNWWVLLYFVVCAISIHMYTRGGSPYQAQILAQPFSRVLSTLFIVNYLRTWDDFLMVAKVFIIFAAITALVAIYQVAAYNFFGIMTSLMPKTEGAKRFFTLGGVTFLRATGLFHHPVFLGQSTAYGSFMLILRLAIPRLRPKSLLPSFLLLGLLVTGLVCSFSRTSWLGVAIVGTLILPPLLWPRWATRYILAVSIMGGLFIVAGGLTATLDLLIGAKTSSVDYRVRILKLGLQAIMRHPWLGVGLNAFGRYPSNLQGLSVHNSLFMSLAELGFIGTIPIIGLYLHGIARAIQNILLAVTPEDRGLAVVLFSMLMLSLFMQQFEQALHLHINFLLLGSIEALWIHLRQRAGHNILARHRRDESVRNLPRMSNI